MMKKKRANSGHVAPPKKLRKTENQRGKETTHGQQSGVTSKTQSLATKNQKLHSGQKKTRHFNSKQRPSASCVQEELKDFPLSAAEDTDSTANNSEVLSDNVYDSDQCDLDLSEEGEQEEEDDSEGQDEGESETEGATAEESGSEEGGEDGFESLDEEDGEEFELESEEEEGAKRQVVLTAREFKRILDDACRSKDGSEVKQLTALAKSLMRSLLSPSSAVKPDARTAYKSGKQADAKQTGKAQELKGMSAKIEGLKKTATYIFDEDLEEIGSHLRRIMVTLEETLEQQEPKNRSSFYPLLAGMWRDMVIFLKNRGARDNVSRELILGLGSCLVRSLINKPKLVLPFYHRFVEVCMKSDPTESPCMNQIKLFFTVAAERLEMYQKQRESMTKKKSISKHGGGDYKQILKTVQVAFRRLLSVYGFAASAKRLGQKALMILRLTALIIVDVAAILKAKNQTKICFDALKGLLEKMEVELHKDVDTKKTAKLKKKGALKIEYELYTWRLFFDIFVIVLLMKPEEGEASGAPSSQGSKVPGSPPKECQQMRALSTSVFKILTLMARRCCGRYDYLPYALKCVSLLLLLSRSLKTFQPIGILMFKIGFLLHGNESRAIAKQVKDAKIPKPIEVKDILFIQKEELGSLKIREGLYEQYISQITEYCGLLARHPAFAEQSPILTRNLRQIAKATEEPLYRGKLKQLAEAIEKTSRQVQNERAKLKLSQIPLSLFVFSDTIWRSFALAPLTKKPKMLDFWEINLQATSN